MNQSKRYSLLEAITNTIAGFFVSILIQIIIYPLMGIPVTISQNITITVVFTIASILRGYIVRRIFNEIKSNMKSIEVNHIVILESNPTYKQLKQLEALTESEDIKNNGKIIVKCNLKAFKDGFKKAVAGIFGITPAKIYLTTTEL